MDIVIVTSQNKSPLIYEVNIQALKTDNDNETTQNNARQKIIITNIKVQYKWVKLWGMKKSE